MKSRNNIRSDDNKSTLSAMLFSYQSEQWLASSAKMIIDRFELEKIPFELIIIDDGSTDNSFKVAKELEQQDRRIKAFQLSKNYGLVSAHFAGLTLAEGDCAVAIPDDLELPLDSIIQMYKKWEEGIKIIVGCRENKKDKLSSRIFSSIYFNLLNKVTDVTLPKSGAGGWLIDREIIDIINKQVSPKNTSSLIEILRLGFEPAFIYYASASAIDTRWTFQKKKKVLLDSIFASTSFPIKFISYLGLFISLICFILIVLIIFGKLFSDNSLFGFPIPGWATLLTFVTMFNGLILLCIGIVAEYIWRIYEEVKGRPSYIIRKEKDLER